MRDIPVIILSVISNFIIYLAFGSFITGPVGKKRGDEHCPILLSTVAGFFLYYLLFFVFCVPPMKYYRPMSLLTKIWVPTVVILVIVSAILNHKRWAAGARRALGYLKEHPCVTFFIAVLIGLQVFLVSCTYNFTLDAAYYVANVATSVETDMMNVYDPFTGAWQDHYEMRYFFATYQIRDAVVCQLTGIPALVYTKSVMAVTIIILTNIVYFMIARELFTGSRASDDNGVLGMTRVKSSETAVVVMMAIMLVINMTFITIYTSSLFLMTRTYEGKSIVGNLAVMTLFLLFIKMNDDKLKHHPWFIVFTVCFGAATISSSANMLMPVELTVLFVPMMIRKKAWRMIPGYIACVIPGVVFSLIYVLYVKGYFVFYTFPK